MKPITKREPAVIALERDFSDATHLKKYNTSQIWFSDKEVKEDSDLTFGIYVFGPGQQDVYHYEKRRNDDLYLPEVSKQLRVGDYNLEVPEDVIRMTKDVEKLGFVGYVQPGKTWVPVMPIIKQYEALNAAKPSVTNATPDVPEL